MVGRRISADSNKTVGLTKVVQEGFSTQRIENKIVDKE